MKRDIGRVSRVFRNLAPLWPGGSALLSRSHDLVRARQSDPPPAQMSRAAEPAVGLEAVDKRQVCPSSWTEVAPSTPLRTSSVKDLHEAISPESFGGAEENRFA